MLSFRVDDMTCDHCASIITKAMKAVDRDAKVSVDLGAHLVQVESAQADARRFSEALTGAGYAPVQVEMHLAIDRHQSLHAMRRAWSMQPTWSRA
jgi:copper chaperone